MKCIICKKEVLENSNQLCQYHTDARNNLKEGFKKWCDAYGELDWKIYIKKIAERSEAGVWVRECCEFLIQDESNEKNKW